MNFQDANGKEFKAGDRFLYIEPSGKNVVIGQVWEPECDRKIMCRLWYKLLWGTNAALPQENSLDVLCHGARRHRLFILDAVTFAEKILGIELTETQRVILENME